VVFTPAEREDHCQSFAGLVPAKDPKDPAAIVAIVAVAITRVIVAAPVMVSIAMAPF
jgi:hypothetical protein